MKNVIAAACLAAGASVAHASMELISIESLMHAQANEALALFNAVAPLGTTSLGFTFSVDVATGSFSYHALPGQSYNGLAYALDGAGSFDASTQTYSWQSSGSLGADAWSQQGHAPWVGDPTADISGSVSLGGKVIGSLTGTVDIDAAGHSAGTVSFTPTGGTPSSYTVTDFVPGSKQPWTLIWRGQPAQFTPVAATWVVDDTIASVYSGHSEMTITPVPEPASWMLNSIGLAILISRAKRHASPPLRPVNKSL